jgi:ornithine decarboxylase
MDELVLTGVINRISILSPEGVKRTGAAEDKIVFGPTCDSVDRLPGELALPSDIAEGDYFVIEGMGAYSTATNTPFNGFGAVIVATVLSLTV